MAAKRALVRRAPVQDRGLRRMERILDAADAVIARVGYNPKADGTLEKLRAARTDLDRRYVNRVRLGGIKFWLDGSLDTAWFTQPYSTNPPGKTGSYSGFRQIPDVVVDAAFDRFWTTEMQIHMHMNGDAAADQALAAIDKAVKKHGMRDARPVFVHASWLRPDQIEKMKACGAIPSFLPSGIVPGGDGVLRLWGPKRAAGAMAAQRGVSRACRRPSGCRRSPRRRRPRACRPRPNPSPPRRGRSAATSCRWR